jgi:hypothetical protein
MEKEKQIRIHRFHDQIAVSTPNTPQLYFSVEDAKELRKELGRFIRNIENDGNTQWLTTRVIKDGKTVTESTGQKQIQFIG